MNAEPTPKGRQCEYCGHQFWSARYLRLHILTRHADKPLPDALDTPTLTPLQAAFVGHMARAAEQGSQP